MSRFIVCVEDEEKKSKNMNGNAYQFVCQQEDGVSGELAWT